MRARELLDVVAARAASSAWLAGSARAALGRRGARDRTGACLSDIELDELAARLGEVPILDVRRPEEYDGSFGSPCDPRQGHIPGAVNLTSTS